MKANAVPTRTEDLLAAMLAATDEQREAALRVLKGEAPPVRPAPAVPPEGPLLLTVSQAARRLNLSRTTLYRAMRAGRLSKVEVYPGSYRLRRSDVEAIAATPRFEANDFPPPGGDAGTQCSATE